MYSLHSDTTCVQTAFILMLFLVRYHNVRTPRGTGSGMLCSDLGCDKPLRSALTARVWFQICTLSIWGTYLARIANVQAILKYFWGSQTQNERIATPCFTVNCMTFKCTHRAPTIRDQSLSAAQTTGKYPSSHNPVLP